MMRIDSNERAYYITDLSKSVWRIIGETTLEREGVKGELKSRWMLYLPPADVACGVADGTILQVTGGTAEKRVLYAKLATNPPKKEPMSKRASRGRID